MKPKIFVFLLSIIPFSYNGCGKAAFQTKVLDFVDSSSSSSGQETSGNNENSDDEGFDGDGDSEEGYASVGSSLPVRSSTPRFTYEQLYAESNSMGAIAFTDLISGPASGLGDGLGSGVIVTVWGFGLGSFKVDSSSLEFCDVRNFCRIPHVYYWKNADGQLPSGPANLFKSHQMQEIAFSIPSGSALGKGRIKITVGSKISEAPFTVREGSIYHVKASGNDRTGDGSFSNPWASTAPAIGSGGIAPPGSTVYIHQIDMGGLATSRVIFGQNARSSSGLENQFGIISYPGSRVTLTGYLGISPYVVKGMVTSKFDVYASSHRVGTAVVTEVVNGVTVTKTLQDQPIGEPLQYNFNSSAIRASKNGRVIANRITDIPGHCASGTSGAIGGGEEDSHFVKIFGNEVYEYGCAGSSKLHHTTYFSIRSKGEDLEVMPWEFAYNYLHDNKAKFGIHQFDQDKGGPLNSCGDVLGSLRIHSNLIVNQGASAISIGCQCGWTMDAYIENNIIINSGLPTSWDGVDPGTDTGESHGIAIRDSGNPSRGEYGLTGTMFIRNNTIYKWGFENTVNKTGGCISVTGSSDTVKMELTNNICYNDKNMNFIGYNNQSVQQLDNFSGSNNLFFTSSSAKSAAVPPAWDLSHVLSDPLFIFTNTSEILKLEISSNSPAINRSTTSLIYDFYGNIRSQPSNLGSISVR